MITEHGIITNANEILTEEREFYSNLYQNKSAKKNTYEDCVFLKNKHITRVSSKLAAECDAPLTMEECYTALMSMANNKSPGSDGFSVEFYKFFWDDIKDLVFESFQYAFITKRMSIEQRRGVISLIPKKDKEIRI